jgi:hypothetical protein
MASIQFVEWELVDLVLVPNWFVITFLKVGLGLELAKTRTNLINKGSETGWESTPGFNFDYNQNYTLGVGSKLKLEPKLN